eukprot:gene19316-biopygen16281
MLTSIDKHQWSADGKTWVDVRFYSDSGHNGGSTLWWPRDNGRAGDERAYLSVWGDYGSRTGGCCSSSTAVNATHPALPGNRQSTAWGQPFTLNYFVDLQPLPPNTGMSLVAAVRGTTVADDAFWAVECKKISSAATGIVVDMGAVRDFFRPVEGATFCEMLQSHDKHEWSADGVVWVDIINGSSGHNGGSADWWPRDDGRAGDARKHLSVWGTDAGSRTGGCCSSSTAVDMTYPSLPGNGAFPCWGQPFTLNYFVDLTTTMTTTPPRLPPQSTTSVPGVPFTTAAPSTNSRKKSKATIPVVVAVLVTLCVAVVGWWYYAERHRSSTAHGNHGGELDGFVNESIEMMDNPMRAASVGREERGLLGSSAGSLQDDPNYLVPSAVQAVAYELMLVPGAREHRRSAPIYSPPEPPPLPPGWVAGGGADYTYIDEDAPDDGHSRAAIEYATVVDDAQLDRDGYVEGGELPSGPAVYTEPSVRGTGGGGGALARRVLLDSGGYVAGGDIPGLSVYETANTTV